MAYNSKNKLLLIRDIQEYYLLRKEEGVTVTRIYEEINDLYHISRATFYKYLGVNAKKQLKEIQAG